MDKKALAFFSQFLDLGAVKNQLPHPIIFFSKTDGHMYEV
jgi:hypothetical protein